MSSKQINTNKAIALKLVDSIYIHSLSNIFHSLSKLGLQEQTLTFGLTPRHSVN